MSFLKSSRLAALGLAAAAFAGTAGHAESTLTEYNHDETFIRAHFTDPQVGIDMAKSMDPVEVSYEKGYVVLTADEETMRTLDKHGIRYEIDREFAATERSRIDKILAKRSLTGENIPLIPSCYRTVEQTFAAAEKIVKDHPDLAEWITVGKSWEKSKNSSAGYDMNVLILTNKKIKGDKPKLFITSAIHAREYTTAELITIWVEQLAEAYGKDADVTWMLDHHEVHAMLHANPDGRKLAEETAPMKRKNDNKNHCKDRPRSRGVDLNRNFDFLWGEGGSSNRVCSDVFMGASAGSEPETQAIMGYMKKIFKDARGPGEDDKAPLDTPGIYLDYHSYGRLILYAWGHLKKDAPNLAGHRALAQRGAYMTNHLPQIGMGLYKTTGTTSDYSYGQLGVASFTYELGTSFHEKCDKFKNDILPGNLRALTYNLRVVRAPYLLGNAPQIIGLKVTKTGDDFTITAEADDTRYLDAPSDKQKGKEPLVESQNIIDAEVYIDTPPWAGGKPIALEAADGSFNAKKEAIKGTISVPGLKKGKKTTIFVRAKDASDRWGPVYAAYLPES